MDKNFSGNCSQKLFDKHDKQSAIDAITTISKRVIKKKTAEATGDFIENTITDAVAKSYCDKITKVSKISLQNTLETVPSKT